MSNNTYAASEDDLSTNHLITYSITFNGGSVATPANNLIRVTFAGGLPNDTKVFGSCPRLGQLRNNGGLTQTHALLSHSPAIDAGNVNAAGVVDDDQRGPADKNGTVDYPRVSGASALADIGAYEVQQDDVVFNNDFEGCPDLPP
jgi:hypothetical protein